MATNESTEVVESPLQTIPTILHDLSDKRKPKLDSLQTELERLDKTRSVHTFWLGEYVKKGEEETTIDVAQITYSFKRSLARFFLDHPKERISDEDLVRALPRSLRAYLETARLSNLITKASISDLQLVLRYKEGDFSDASLYLASSSFPPDGQLLLPVYVSSRVTDVGRNAVYVHSVHFDLGMPRKPRSASRLYDIERLRKLHDIVSEVYATVGLDPVKRALYRYEKEGKIRRDR